VRRAGNRERLAADCASALGAALDDVVGRTLAVRAAL
jgi:hypothetical protein